MVSIASRFIFPVVAIKLGPFISMFWPKNDKSLDPLELALPIAVPFIKTSPN